MAAPDPRFAQIVNLSVTPDLYAEIRDLWLLHVTNEERLFGPHTDEVAKDAMDKMLSTFTPDCVMELVATGERWTGYDGARAFTRRSFPPSVTWSGFPRLSSSDLRACSTSST